MKEQLGFQIKIGDYYLDTIRNFSSKDSYEIRLKKNGETYDYIQILTLSNLLDKLGIKHEVYKVELEKSIVEVK